MESCTSKKTHLVTLRLKQFLKFALDHLERLVRVIALLDKLFVLVDEVLGRVVVERRVSAPLNCQVEDLWHHAELRETTVQSFDQLRISLLAAACFEAVNIMSAARAYECMRREHLEHLIVLRPALDAVLV